MAELEGRLKAAIMQLHARKDSSYAGAWKRRGERVSVLPNIARKVDRLQAFADGGVELKGETVLDTAVDLYVYAVKYRLLLAEAAGADASLLRRDAPRPFSDHVENFDRLVSAAAFVATDGRTLDNRIRALCDLFEMLWRAVDANSDLSGRQQRAKELAIAAEQIVGLVAASYPGSVDEFVRDEAEPADH